MSACRGIVPFLAEDLVSNVDAALETAAIALADLTSEQRGDGAERLERALAFARLSLRATDPDLLTDAAASALQNQATLIATEPATAAQTSANYHDSLIAAVLMIPAAQGRDIEQGATEDAAGYQRALAIRPKAVEDELDT
jgi:hypothetical protein